MTKIIQSGGFLSSLLSKIAGPLMKAAVLLAKNILASLTITAAASAIDAGIKKKINGSGICFANNNLYNFDWGKEWHNENCSSSWRF